MHYLHCILVNIHDATDEMNGKRKKRIAAVRSFAEAQTECFCGDAYDWRETDSAGRWDDLYPENVILGKEHPDVLLAEVEKRRQSQESELSSNLKMMDAILNQPAEDFIRSLWKLTENGIQTEGDISYRLMAYYLNRVAKLLYGEYFYDSHFYDTDSCTARIGSDTVDKIRQHPEDWALAFFDYHF